ncbi:hypothetical protein HDU86_008338 [Geranomyces michiganensis]|nr:hypothetical protein HDU86_008338 [Geranomyces michiganensis]
MSIDDPTIIYKDNTSAIALSINPDHYTCTEHIDIQHHFACKDVLLKSVKLEYPRTDLNVLEDWQTFTADIAAAQSKMDSVLIPAYLSLLPVRSKATVNDEEAVRRVFMQAVGHRVQECLEQLGLQNPEIISVTGNANVVGLPDFVSPRNTNILTDWSAVKANPTAKLCRVIHQLFGYMTFNHLRYGVLTNYVNMWFFRRVDAPQGGRLEISLSFSFTDAPALLEAWIAIILLAETQWFYASPTTSPAPPRRAPSAAATPIPTADPFKVQSVDSSSVVFIKGMDRSRVGVIVRGTYLQRQVILKEKWATDELDSEVAVYSDLRALCGAEILHVVAYIEIWKMLRILILEDCGENLRTYRTRGGDIAHVINQCTRCLRAINALGYMHNDVKEENFVIQNGVVRLIDFGLASKG